MIAFGLASIMLCIGTFLRAKISFLRNMLVPASVIAGILGFIFMNLIAKFDINIGTDSVMYTDIVNHLFTISFISISLTSSDSSEAGAGKQIFKGALGMGTVWCLLYALTPLVGMGLISVLGKFFNMDPIYGSMIQYGFAQGPGQAASYGALYEGYGFENAQMVGLAFAAIGFIVAFLVGIPAAKIGINRGLAKNCGQIDSSILKGYLKRDEQTNYMVKDTTVNSNIETLTFHFALIGLCYIGAIGVAKVFSLLPGFLGTSFSGLMFMNGMIAAYIVKFIMKKLKLDFLQENVLQSKITGWTADYLVVCAFMAVGFSVIGEWIVPILVEAAVVTVITFFVCFYFGQRFGGGNDFERTLGLYGTSTGTVPSGISLIRIIDPEFKTNTAVELGVMNIIMFLSTPVYIILLALASKTISLPIAMAGLAVCCIVYLIVLKLSKTWGKKTYSWK
ncbi:MAG: sodium:glutamate symporter [Firmicutes bacterium]|nr:sodium:glutamate symporter [Bacillota bacterium]